MEPNKLGVNDQVVHLDLIKIWHEVRDWEQRRAYWQGFRNGGFLFFLGGGAFGAALMRALLKLLAF